MDEYITDPHLTDLQNEVYKYLLSGQPILGQRQLARAVGLGDYPQRLLGVLASLVVKGKLIPKDKTYER